MARYGKIARCPHHIREELNRRIDNNEPGARLVAWLNTLPEVKQVLDSDFERREISEQNLTEWKEHGYRRWQAQQRALATNHEVTANASELSAQSGGAINESIATILATRFADALLASDGEITDEMRDQLRNEVKILRSISREIARLGRYQHDRDRVHIQRERLDLARERLQLQQSKQENRKNAHAADPASRRSAAKADEMTEEEKDRKLKEFIYPRRLFPEKYAPEPGIESAAASQPTTSNEFDPHEPRSSGRESAPSEPTDNGQRTTDKPGNQTITS